MKNQYSLSDSDKTHPKDQKIKTQESKINDSWVLICKSFKLLLGDG